MIFAVDEFRRAGSRTLAKILRAHLTDDTLDDDEAETVFREHLRIVYRPSIRSIITVGNTVKY